MNRDLSSWNLTNVLIAIVVGAVIVGTHYLFSSNVASIILIVVLSITLLNLINSICSQNYAAIKWNSLILLLQILLVILFMLT